MRGPGGSLPPHLTFGRCELSFTCLTTVPDLTSGRSGSVLHSAGSLLSWLGDYVPIYRVYCVDALGRISGDRNIEAKDHADAVAAVRAFKRPAEAEIWLHDRRIARVPPASS